MVHFSCCNRAIRWRSRKSSPWERLLVPTLGGLVAGLILYWGFRLVGRQGSSDLLEVVVAGDGRLPFRTESVKTASALVSIATGASIGREGGITQLSATLASKLGQLAKWPPYRLRLLVGCGAAAGISAAYNAPIAGAVFASLIVLGNFSMSLFAPLVCASVIATTVSRSFFGIEPWYQVPAFPAADAGAIAVVCFDGRAVRRRERASFETAARQPGAVQPASLADLREADAGRS